MAYHMYTPVLWCPSPALLIMGDLTIDSLKTETNVTDDQLKRLCLDRHLKEISIHVGQYHQFASIFGLRDGEVSDIDTDLRLNYALKTEKVFLTWKKNNSNPSYLNFVTTCIRLREGGLARRMCQLCAGERQFATVIVL